MSAPKLRAVAEGEKPSAQAPKTLSDAVDLDRRDPTVPASNS